MAKGTRLDLTFGLAAALLAVGLALLADGRIRPAIAPLGVAAIVALVGWRNVRVDARELARREAELVERERALGARQTELADEVEERETALEQERRRLAACRETERRWALELRRTIAELHAARGALGRTDDVPTLVLRTALSLLGAEKGALLSRNDEDDDGDLDLIAAEGFAADPSASPVVQRFARETIDRDRTVKEDDVDAPEIDNLVAIPIYVRDRFDGVVVAANKPGGFRDQDDEVLLALGDHAGAVLRNARLQGELRGTYLATVAMLGEAIEACDPFLRGHSVDVSRYVGAVADRLGMNQRTREALVFAALLHDIGKIGISERILLKPAALTPEERSVVELHPRIGYRLIQRVPALREIAPGILHHHERWDGEGYPSGLKGTQIPLEARVIAIADSFSAMTADRPYRRRLTLDEACAELERCAGTQFDPEVVKLFLDEVRATPPRTIDVSTPLVEDPEIEARRDEDEPLLGFGELALTDSLTLLYSHRHLHEEAHAHAAQCAVQGGTFGLALVELPELPQTNVTQGWEAGDDALREVARCIESLAVQVDGTACRYSGRRIALLAPGADEAAMERISERIAEGLANGPAVRVATAVSRAGDSGADVVERARAELGLRPVLA